MISPYLRSEQSGMRRQMFYRVIRVIVSVVEHISVLLLLFHLDLLFFRSTLRFTGRQAKRTITGGKMEGGGLLSAVHLNLGGCWGSSLFTRNAVGRREEDGGEGTGGIGSTYHDDERLALLH